MSKIINFLNKLLFWRKKPVIIDLGKRKPRKFLPREIRDTFSRRRKDQNSEYRRLMNIRTRNRMRRKMRRATRQSMRAHS